VGEAQSANEEAREAKAARGTEGAGGSEVMAYKLNLTPGDHINDSLRYALYEEASRSLLWWNLFPPTPMTRWQRLRSRARWWWYDHRPRLHFGPCDTGEW
jgi:hypothetical protein